MMKNFPSLLSKKYLMFYAGHLRSYSTKLANTSILLNYPVMIMPGSGHIFHQRCLIRNFAPTWQIMIDMIRNAAPRSRILFHSSGNIELFISRLCSMGVDIIHGISEQPGIDLTKIKSSIWRACLFLGCN